MRKIFIVNLIIYILGLILLALIGFFCFDNDELVIFPGNKKLFCRPYDDNTDSSGLSTCSLLTQTSNALVFSYTLREHPVTHKNNYAGLAIDWGCDSSCDSFIDITNYDNFIIQIGTESALRFKIHLKTWIDSITCCNNFKTFYYEAFEEPFNDKKLSYFMPLKKFYRPDITYECIDNHKLPKNLLPNHKKLFSIDIQTGTKEGSTNETKSGVFSITKIALSRNSPVISYNTAFNIFSILYLFLGYFVLRYLRKHKYIPSRPNDQSHVKKEYSEKVKIAIRMIEENPKVSNKDIRLKINIGGKNGDSVFSRKFKEEVGVSPSEYRFFVTAKKIISNNNSISADILYKRINEELHLKEKLKDSESLEHIFKTVLGKSISDYIQSSS